MMTAADEELAARVRAELADREIGEVREVAMFGGLSFMVNERMVVSVQGDGGLLVRVDPADADELLARPGVRVAEMGSGRSMGRSWLTVPADRLASADDLRFWVDTALAFRRTASTKIRKKR